MKNKNDKMRGIGWFILDHTQPEPKHPTKAERARMKAKQDEAAAEAEQVDEATVVDSAVV